MHYASPDRLRRHVQHLAAQPRPAKDAAAMHSARAYCAEHLELAGWSTCEQPVAMTWRLGLTDDPTGWRSWWPLKVHRLVAGANLIAELDPTDPRPPLVIAAHLDTMHASPGADDNASGVAVILELATLLTAQRPETPVLLAILDLEETGHFGSKALADSLRPRGVTAMVCLDAVGYFTDEPGSQRTPTGAGFVMPAVASHVKRNGARGDFALVIHKRSSRHLAHQWCTAAAASAPHLLGVPLADPRPDGRLGALTTLLAPPLASLDRSDHAPFWRAGVPAILLTDTASFRNPHYHRPTDVPSTLDYQRLAAVTAATAAVATRPAH